MLWPAVIFFWIQFILSFILLLYLDLEPSEPVVKVETTDIIEVVDVDKVVVEAEIDTITLEPPKNARPVTWMETVYLGIPNVNPVLSFLTTGINAVMLMMTLDLTFRTYLFYPATDLMFHRPIPTSPYTANIFIRSPPEAPLPLRLFYKPVNVLYWETGPNASEFSNNSDFTSIVKLEGLAPGTPYTYAVLPPDVDVTTANQSSFGKFETFPSPGKRGRWSFGSSSCIKPGIPYNPLKHPLHIQGLEYLEKDMSDLKFFTFLGTTFSSMLMQATLFTQTSHIVHHPLQNRISCSIVRSIPHHLSNTSFPISPCTTFTTTTISLTITIKENIQVSLKTQLDHSSHTKVTQILRQYTQM